MPNHIHNELTILAKTKPALEEVLKFLSDGVSVIDFNKITKMPDNFESDVKHDGSLPDWYTWARENWGTKWNAYGTSINDNVITFETAWSGVPILISKLAEKFPDVTFQYEFSDEDIGRNTGIFIFAGNECSETVIDDSSNGAYELAFSHRPDSKKYYHKRNGQWEYNENAE